MSPYPTHYDPDADFDCTYTRATAARIASRVSPGSRILDLGCATGIMAQYLCENRGGVEFLGIDRSDDYLEIAIGREIPGARFLRSDIGSLDSLDFAADHVILTNVLHEVARPLDILRAVKRLSSHETQVHITLPNPSSLHRQVALQMGIIESLDEISPRGNRFATKRMVSRDRLESWVKEAGFEVAEFSGIFLKPFPNEVLATLDSLSIRSLEVAGSLLPDYCAMNYVVAH